MTIPTIESQHMANQIFRIDVTENGLGPNGRLQLRLLPLLDLLKSGYAIRQKQYGYDGLAGEQPLRAFGYDIESTTVSFLSADRQLKPQPIDFVFRVRPLPYAFLRAGDGGVSQAAADAIAQDLRDAIFDLPPLMGPGGRRPERATEVLDRMVKLDPSSQAKAEDYSGKVTVELLGSSSATAAFTASVPLGA